MIYACRDWSRINLQNQQNCRTTRPAFGKMATTRDPEAVHYFDVDTCILHAFESELDSFGRSITSTSVVCLIAC